MFLESIQLQKFKLSVLEFMPIEIRHLTPFGNKYKWSWPCVFWVFANILDGVHLNGYKKYKYWEIHKLFSEVLALSTGTTRVLAPFKYNMPTEKSHLTRSWRWHNYVQRVNIQMYLEISQWEKCNLLVGLNDIFPFYLEKNPSNKKILRPP